MKIQNDEKLNEMLHFYVKRWWSGFHFIVGGGDMLSIKLPVAIVPDNDVLPVNS